MDVIPYIPFLTAERMAMFWGNVKNLMLLAMPLLMVFMATKFAGLFISVFRAAFGRHFGHKDESFERKDDYGRD